MRGQIIKRGTNRYLVRIPEGRDATGKRLYHNKTIHGTKKTAEEYLAKKLREQDLGITITHSDESLADYMIRWLRDVISHDVQGTTLHDY